MSRTYKQILIGFSEGNTTNPTRHQTSRGWSPPQDPSPTVPVTLVTETLPIETNDDLQRPSQEYQSDDSTSRSEPPSEKRLMNRDTMGESQVNLEQRTAGRSIKDSKDYQLVNRKGILGSMDCELKLVTCSTQEEVAQVVQGKQVAIVIGDSGTGKTSLVLDMVGYKLKEKEDEDGDMVYECEDDEVPFKIGHGADSTTKCLQIGMERKGPCAMVWIDTPGQNETGGYEKEFKQNKLTQAAMDNCQGFSAIVLLNGDECLTKKLDPNNSKLVHDLQSIIQIFGEENAIKKVTILFSQLRPSNGPEFVLRRLKKYAKSESLKKAKLETTMKLLNSIIAEAEAHKVTKPLVFKPGDAKTRGKLRKWVLAKKRFIKGGGARMEMSMEMKKEFDAQARQLEQSTLTNLLENKFKIAKESFEELQKLSTDARFLENRHDKTAKMVVLHVDKIVVDVKNFVNRGEVVSGIDALKIAEEATRTFTKKLHKSFESILRKVEPAQDEILRLIEKQMELIVDGLRKCISNAQTPQSQHDTESVHRDLKGVASELGKFRRIQEEKRVGNKVKKVVGKHLLAARKETDQLASSVDELTSSVARRSSSVQEVSKLGDQVKINLKLMEALQEYGLPTTTLLASSLKKLTECADRVFDKICSNDDPHLTILSGLHEKLFDYIKNRYRKFEDDNDRKRRMRSPISENKIDAAFGVDFAIPPRPNEFFVEAVIQQTNGFYEHLARDCNVNKDKESVPKSYSSSNHTDTQRKPPLNSQGIEGGNTKAVDGGHENVSMDVEEEGEEGEEEDTKDFPVKASKSSNRLDVARCSQFSDASHNLMFEFYLLCKAVRREWKKKTEDIKLIVDRIMKHPQVSGLIDIPPSYLLVLLLPGLVVLKAGGSEIVEILKEDQSFLSFVLTLDQRKLPNGFSLAVEALFSLICKTHLKDFDWLRLSPLFRKFSLLESQRFSRIEYQKGDMVLFSRYLWPWLWQCKGRIVKTLADEKYDIEMNSKIFTRQKCKLKLCSPLKIVQMETNNALVEKYESNLKKALSFVTNTSSQPAVSPIAKKEMVKALIHYAPNSNTLLRILRESRCFINLPECVDSLADWISQTAKKLDGGIDGHIFEEIINITRQFPFFKHPKVAKALLDCESSFGDTKRILDFAASVNVSRESEAEKRALEELKESLIGWYQHKLQNKLRQLSVRDMILRSYSLLDTLFQRIPYLFDRAKCFLDALKIFLRMEKPDNIVYNALLDALDSSSEFSRVENSALEPSSSQCSRVGKTALQQDIALAIASEAWSRVHRDITQDVVATTRHLERVLHLPSSQIRSTLLFRITTTATTERRLEIPNIVKWSRLWILISNDNSCHLPSKADCKELKILDLHPNIGYSTKLPDSEKYLDTLLADVHKAILTFSKAILDGSVKVKDIDSLSDKDLVQMLHLLDTLENVKRDPKPYQAVKNRVKKVLVMVKQARAFMREVVDGRKEPSIQMHHFTKARATWMTSIKSLSSGEAVNKWKRLFKVGTNEGIIIASSLDWIFPLTRSQVFRRVWEQTLLDVMKETETNREPDSKEKNPGGSDKDVTSETNEKIISQEQVFKILVPRAKLCWKNLAKEVWSGSLSLNMWNFWFRDCKVQVELQTHMQSSTDGPHGWVSEAIKRHSDFKELFRFRKLIPVLIRIRDTSFRRGFETDRKADPLYLNLVKFVKSDETINMKQSQAKMKSFRQAGLSNLSNLEADFLTTLANPATDKLIHWLRDQREHSRMQKIVSFVNDSFNEPDIIYIVSVLQVLRNDLESSLYTRHRNIESFLNSLRKDLRKGSENLVNTLQTASEGFPRFYERVIVNKEKSAGVQALEKMIRVLEHGVLQFRSVASQENTSVVQVEGDIDDIHVNGDIDDIHVNGDIDDIHVNAVHVDTNIIKSRVTAEDVARPMVKAGVKPDVTRFIASRQTYTIKDLMDIFSHVRLTQVTPTIEEKLKVKAKRERFGKFLHLATQIQKMLLSLRQIGHFNFQANYEKSFALSDPKCHLKLSSEINLLGKEIESWTQLIQDHRSRHFCLNFFTVRQILKLLDLLSSRHEKWIPKTVSQSCYKAEVDFVIMCRLMVFNVDEERVALKYRTQNTRFTKKFDVWDTGISSGFLSDSKFRNHVEGALTSLAQLLNDLFDSQAVVTPDLELIIDRGSLFEATTLGTNWMGKLALVQTKSQASLFPVIMTIYAKRNRMPEPSEILFCTERTTLEDIQLLLYRFFLAANHGWENQIFILASFHLLPYTKQTEVADALDDMLSKFKIDSAATLVLLSCEKNTWLGNRFAKCKTSPPRVTKGELETFVKSSVGSLAKRSQSLGSRGLVMCVTSETDGGGKTDRILTKIARRMTTDAKLVYLKVPFCSSFSLFHLLMKTNTRIDRKHHDENAIPTRSTQALHFDFACDLPSDAAVTIFELVFYGIVKDTEACTAYRKKSDDVCYFEISTARQRTSILNGLLGLLPAERVCYCRDQFSLLEPTFHTEAGKKIVRIVLQRRKEIDTVVRFLNAYKTGRLDAKTLQASKSAQVDPRDAFDLINFFSRFDNRVHTGVASYTEATNFVRFLHQGFQGVDTETGYFLFAQDHTYLSEDGFDYAAFRTVFCRLVIETSRIFAVRQIPKGAQHLAHRTQHLRTWAEMETHPIAIWKTSRDTKGNMHPDGLDIFCRPRINDSKHKAIDVIRGYIDSESIHFLKRQGLHLDKDWSTFAPQDFFDLLRHIDGWTPSQRKEKLRQRFPDYCMTVDNFSKMVQIVLRLQYQLPVVVMGETGCGKSALITTLMKVLNIPLKVLNVHGGLTSQQIVRWVEDAANSDSEGNPNKRKVLFFDEVNTSGCLDLFKEIICDRSMRGVQLADNILIVAACNPYRFKKEEAKRLEQIGLQIAVKKHHLEAVGGWREHARMTRASQADGLVYRVHALPDSILDHVYDFGALSKQKEFQYLCQMVDNVTDDSELCREFSGLIKLSQEMVRELNDNERASASLRDVSRCCKTFLWFQNEFLPKIDAFGKESDKLGRISMIMALAYCFYFRLDREQRRIYARRVENGTKMEKKSYLNPIYTWKSLNDFDGQVQKVIRTVVCGNFREPKGIIFNEALVENIFVMLCSILQKIPIFIIGKPGSSKTLALTLIGNNMKGNHSDSDLLKQLPPVNVFSYQCSPLSTPEGIEDTYAKAEKSQKGDQKTISVVLLDEVGLAELSPRLPLKVLHKILDEEHKHTTVGISNWCLDPAKMNRAIHLYRPSPDYNDLVKTGEGIATNERLKRKLGAIAKAYQEVLKSQSIPDFWGLRDYYSLVKSLNRAMETSGSSNLDSSMLKKIILRNFGGIPEMRKKILQTFFDKLSMELEDDRVDSLDLIRQNLASAQHLKSYYNRKEAQHQEQTKKHPQERREPDPDAHLDSQAECRHLMVLTSNHTALPLLFDVGLVNPENTRVIISSDFPADKSDHQVFHNLQTIKHCMSAGKTVVLVNCENIFEALYDLLNQHYTTYGGTKRYARLAFGANSELCEVDPGFRLIVIVDAQDVHRLDPPLLNRFEKQILDRSLLMTAYHYRIRDRVLKFVKMFLQKESKEDLKHRNPSQSAVLRAERSAFVGYHSAILPSLILSIVPANDNANPNAEKAKSLEHYVRKAIERLLWISPPEAICRITKSVRRNIMESFQIDLHSSYLQEQCHENMVDLMASRMLDQKTWPDHLGTLAQITTFSLFSRQGMATARNQMPCHSELYVLHEFSAQTDLKQSVHTFFDSHLPGSKHTSREESASRLKSGSVLILQCDQDATSLDRIRHAKYIIQEERCAFLAKLGNYQGHGVTTEMREDIKEQDKHIQHQPILPQRYQSLKLKAISPGLCETSEADIGVPGGDEKIPTRFPQACEMSMSEADIGVPGGDEKIPTRFPQAFMEDNEERVVSELDLLPDVPADGNIDLEGKTVGNGGDKRIGFVMGGIHIVIVVHLRRSLQDPQVFGTRKTCEKFCVDFDELWHIAYVDSIEKTYALGQVSMKTLMTEDISVKDLFASRTEKQPFELLVNCFRPALSKLVYPFRRSIKDVQNLTALLVGWFENGNRFAKHTRCLVHKMLDKSEVKLNIHAIARDERTIRLNGTFLEAIHIQLFDQVVIMLSYLFSHMERNFGLDTYARNLQAYPAHLPKIYRGLEDDQSSKTTANPMASMLHASANIEIWEALSGLFTEQLISGERFDAETPPTRFRVENDGRQGSTSNTYSPFQARFPYSFFIYSFLKSTAEKMQEFHIERDLNKDFDLLFTQTGTKCMCHLSEDLLQNYCHDFVNMAFAAPVAIDRGVQVDLFCQLLKIDSDLDSKTKTLTLASVHNFYSRNERRLSLVFELCDLHPTICRMVRKTLADLKQVPAICPTRAKLRLEDFDRMLATRTVEMVSLNKSGCMRSIGQFASILGRLYPIVQGLAPTHSWTQVRLGQMFITSVGMEAFSDMDSFRDAINSTPFELLIRTLKLADTQGYVYRCSIQRLVKLTKIRSFVDYLVHFILDNKSSHRMGTAKWVSLAAIALNRNPHKPSTVATATKVHVLQVFLKQAHVQPLVSSHLREIIQRHVGVTLNEPGMALLAHAMEANMSSMPWKYHIDQLSMETKMDFGASGDGMNRNSEAKTWRVLTKIAQLRWGIAEFSTRIQKALRDNRVEVLGNRLMLALGRALGPWFSRSKKHISILRILMLNSIVDFGGLSALTKTAHLKPIATNKQAYGWFRDLVAPFWSKSGVVQDRINPFNCLPGFESFGWATQKVKVAGPSAAKDQLEKIIAGEAIGNRVLSPALAAFIYRSSLENGDGIQSKFLVQWLVSTKILNKIDPKPEHRQFLEGMLQSLHCLGRRPTSILAVDTKSDDDKLAVARISTHVATLALTPSKGALNRFLWNCVFAPGKLQDTWMPCMVNDEEAHIRRIILKNEKVGVYKCPNGHKYYIGDCTVAYTIGKCADCGAAIGGKNHKLIANNATITNAKKPVVLKDAPPSGYCFTNRSGELALTFRSMKPESFRLLRFIVHSALFMGHTASKGEAKTWHLNITKAVNPDHIPPNASDPNLLAAYFAHQAHQDWTVLRSITSSGAGMNSVTLQCRIHEFLNRIISNPNPQIQIQIEAHHDDGTFIHSKNRDQFEREFQKHTDFLFAREGGGWYNHHDLMDKFFSSSKRSQSLMDLLAGEDLPLLWRPRTRFWSIDRFTLEFKKWIERLNEESSRFPVLREYLFNNSQLRGLSFLPSVLRFQRLMIEHCDWRMSSTEASSMTLENVISDLKRSNRTSQEIRSAFTGFAQAWEWAGNWVSRFECIQISHLFKKMEISLDDYKVKLKYLLPQDKDEGVPGLAMGKYLIDLHNKMVRGGRGSQLGLQSHSLAESEFQSQSSRAQSHFQRQFHSQIKSKRNFEPKSKQFPPHISVGEIDKKVESKAGSHWKSNLNPRMDFPVSSRLMIDTQAIRIGPDLDKEFQRFVALFDTTSHDETIGNRPTTAAMATAETKAATGTSEPKSGPTVTSAAKVAGMATATSKGIAAGQELKIDEFSDARHSEGKGEQDKSEQGMTQGFRKTKNETEVGEGEGEGEGEGDVDKGKDVEGKAVEGEERAERQDFEVQAMFEAAELFLAERLVGSKPFIECEIPLMHYIDQEGQMDVDKLSSRVPQEALPTNIRRRIEAQIGREKQGAMGALRHIETCIRFLLSTGGEFMQCLDGDVSSDSKTGRFADEKLSEYMTECLHYRQEDSASIPSDMRHVALKHLASLWEVLFEPCEHLHTDYLSPFDPTEHKKELQRVSKAAKALRRSGNLQLVILAMKYFVKGKGHLTQGGNRKRNKSIHEFLSLCTLPNGDGSSFDQHKWFNCNFPKNIKLKHYGQVYRIFEHEDRNGSD